MALMVMSPPVKPLSADAISVLPVLSVMLPACRFRLPELPTDTAVV
ncbi:hypothetical protein Y695_02174 [Hydrogenophaga sp. T4]|nr:hypothetical protein Y695_02174 [Hydrogenophaga sp. T4]